MLIPDETVRAKAPSRHAAFTQGKKTIGVETLPTLAVVLIPGEAARAREQNFAQNRFHTKAKILRLRIDFCPKMLPFCSESGDFGEILGQ